MDLVDQEYWNAGYDHVRLDVANDRLTTWLKPFVSGLPAGSSVFEVGCYPGRYLSWIGLHGFVVNGIDLAPQTARLNNWFKQQSIEHAMIKQGDGLEYMCNTEDKYDFVCSFGFIEHFTDFKSVIKAHARVVKPGGLLVITVPNFRGYLQKWLHSSLDGGNLSLHNLNSMAPEIWCELAKDLDFKVNFAGPFGGFDFWCKPGGRTASASALCSLLMSCGKRLGWIPSRMAYSPYLGLVATKLESVT